MLVPSIEVSHLPTAASYYAAILQPLGLYYVHQDQTATPAIDQDHRNRQSQHLPQPRLVAFGVDGKPLVHICQRAPLAERPRISTLKLTAPSPDAVSAFHAAAQQANPAAILSSTTESLHLDTDGGVAQAMVRDFDGNTVHSVYPNTRPRNGSVFYAGQPVRSTQSTSSEVNRILDWNFDVASTSTHAPTMSRAPEAPPSLRRASTAGSQAPPPENANGGFSTATMMGALLGVAAGAAVTYGYVSGNRARSPRRAMDLPVSDSPSLVRRSTYPEGYDDGTAAYTYRKLPPTEMPTRRLSQAGGYSATQHAPPTYGITGQALPARSPSKDDNDVRSRHSSRHEPSRTPSVRSTSEGPRSRMSASYEDDVRRSRASARQPTVSKPPLSRTGRPLQSSQLDYDSYVTARTQQSKVPRHAPVPQAIEYETTRRRSRSSSHSSATVRPPVSGALQGRTASYVSARNVPLPPSGVGSTQPYWDDDMASVAPSDSISCVGSKGPRRSRSRRH